MGCFLTELPKSLQIREIGRIDWAEKSSSEFGVFQKARLSLTQREGKMKAVERWKDLTTWPEFIDGRLQSSG